MTRRTAARSSADALPAVGRSVEIADFETELVVLVPSTRRVHLLEPAVSLLVNSCQLGHSREQFVEEVSGATEQSVEDTRRWCERALEALRAAEIIDPGP